MTTIPRNLEWADGALRILDQRRLPAVVAYVDCRSAEQVADAIACLAVRGAPAIGLAGAYGVALAAAAAPSLPGFEACCARLANARPTAVNLSREVGRCRAAALGAAGGGAAAMAAAALSFAAELHREEGEVCAAIAAGVADMLPSGGWVLTHCHTGALATGGVGTALGGIARAFSAGRVAGVYACESRPLWQGARLTAWECAMLGVPCKVIADGAAGFALATGRCSAVVVGADRVARDGAVANKIGTYPLAVLALRHALPFLVASPWSSIDPGRLGASIEIEERDPSELTRPVCPPGAAAWNPAFDITPGALISALITERGIYRRPYALDREAVAADPGEPG